MFSIKCAKLACPSWLPEVYLINLWLLGEECKPIIICNGDKTLHLVFPGTLNDLTKVKRRLDLFLVYYNCIFTTLTTPK